MTARPTEGGTLVVGPGERGPGFGDVLRAEWLKLRTVRSTWCPARSATGWSS